MNYHAPEAGMTFDTIRALKKWLSPTLISADPSEDELSSIGVFIVEVQQKPDVAGDEIAILNDIATFEGGRSVRGWTVRDKTPEELLADVPWQSYAEARLAVVQWIDGLTAQTINLYPDAVQKRWAIEEEAARAVKAGTADAYQTQIVTEEGAAKGRTAIEHADAIIVNADRFHGIADQVNKLFLATDKALSDASSPMEYPAIFATAQAQAAPLAAAYGLEV